MKKLYPEKLWERGGSHVSILRKFWSDTSSGKNMEDFNSFSMAMNEYLNKVSAYQMQYTKTENLLELLRIETIYMHIPMQDLMAKMESPTFSTIGTDTRFAMMQSYELERIKTMFSGILTDESIMTEWIMRHAYNYHQQVGAPIYQVSPGLQWQLEHTELRRLQVDELRLPFPVIYLELPNDKYEVWNVHTGWHKAEGVYVAEDFKCDPRTWRLLLIGRANENSPSEYDDALYHWTYLLKSGNTVENALQDTLQMIEDIKAGRKTRKAFINGKETEVVMSTRDSTIENIEHFSRMEATLIKLFRYVMNVTLYVTDVNAEEVLRDGNPEYQALRDRALRAKGTKRTKLFGRLRTLKSYPRRVIGGSIIIDRATREAAESGKQGGKHSVRYVVSGHWHHYWVHGVRTRKWVAPYWKGPEYAPLTQKKRVAKLNKT